MENESSKSIDLGKLKMAIKEDLMRFEGYPEEFDFKTLKVEIEQGCVHITYKDIEYPIQDEDVWAEADVENMMDNPEFQKFLQRGINNETSDAVNNLDYLKVYEQDIDDVVDTYWEAGENVFGPTIKGGVTSDLQFIIYPDKAQERIESLVINEPPAINEEAEYNDLVLKKRVIKTMAMADFKKAIGNFVNIGKDGSYHIDNSPSPYCSYRVNYPTKSRCIEDIDQIINRHFKH